MSDQQRPDSADQPITVDEGKVCRHCGRPLVWWATAWLHATPWDENMQRELYRHCRVQVAYPWEDADGAPPADDLEREEALGAYFAGGDTDWENPDLMTTAGFLAFRAGWRAARG